MAELSDYQSINGTNITFSPCCNMFVVSVDRRIICTGCKQIIKDLVQKDNVIMRYKSNANNNKTIRPKIGMQELENENEKLKRYAIDDTYELCDKKCPECGSFSRYCRKFTGELVHICSNANCRTVFD
jgi:hypothetical protein